MKNTELQTLDNNIRNRINELQSILGSEAADARTNEHTATDFDEKVREAVERQVTEKENRELTRLQSNLSWLESDAGGCCEQCGCEIPYARLRAVPETRLCINCAE